MTSSPDHSNDLTIPAPLQAEVRAMAAAAHRPADEIVREALESYLGHSPASLPIPDARQRAASADHMREQRKGRVLPPGMTIEEMIAHGRA